MSKDVIIACDFSSKEEVMNFLDKFQEEKPFLKIGMELFYAEGPEIVREIKKRGHKIFLDLKLHDIPNTVKKSMAVLSRLDVDMCNLHAGGTIPMMEAVRNAFLEEKAMQKETGIKNLEEVDNMSGFIFCNRFGNLHNPQAINRAIKRITETYNSEEIVNAKKEKRPPVIIPHFSCHHLRHTFCTRLCENETNLKVIQTVMGHADIKTTMDVYAEITDMKKTEAFENLSRNMNIF